MYDAETTTEYRANRSRVEHDALGEAIAARLGPLQSKSLVGVNFRLSNAQSTMEVTYNAIFEKDSGTITLVLQSEGDDWKIQRLNVSSPALNQPMSQLLSGETDENAGAAEESAAAAEAE